MNLRQIEYFTHVAEQGSFSKAARLLGIAQPALSRQVRALEAELRETLLLRNGRGVQPTEAGQRLLEHGQEILRMVTHAREDLGAQRNEPVGRIVIGLPPSLALQLTRPLIEAFARDMPKARLEIVEGFSVHLSEWLATSRVDVGLMFNPDPLPSMDITPVLKEPMCLVGPAATRLPKAVALKSLGKYPLVMPQRDHIFRKLMDYAAAMEGVRLNVAWEVSSVPAILDLVTAGHGYAALTEATVKAYAARRRLAVTPITDPEIPCQLCLVVPSQRRPTPLATQAAALLKQLVRAL